MCLVSSVPYVQTADINIDCKDLFTDKLVNLINIVIFNKYSIFETLPDWFSPLLIVVRVRDNSMIITGYLLIQQCLTMTISDFCCNDNQFLDSSQVAF